MEAGLSRIGGPGPEFRHKRASGACRFLANAPVEGVAGAGVGLAPHAAPNTDNATKPGGAAIAPEAIAGRTCSRLRTTLPLSRTTSHAVRLTGRLLAAAPVLRPAGAAVPTRPRRPHGRHCRSGEQPAEVAGGVRFHPDRGRHRLVWFGCLPRHQSIEPAGPAVPGFRAIRGFPRRPPDACRVVKGGLGQPSARRSPSPAPRQSALFRLSPGNPDEIRGVSHGLQSTVVPLLRYREQRPG